MGVVRIHAVTYTAVNAMLIAIWSITGGSFWPIWPIVTWGAALGLHAGVTASLPGSGRRHQLSGGRPTELEDRVAPHELEASPPHQGRRQWVVVMFTDIVGSTGLNESLGDEEWHRILTAYRSRIRGAVTACGGNEVGTAGDGVLARFDTPADAVLCAIEIQCETDELNREDQFAPAVRIGVHAGEAVAAESDLLGKVVNLASRVADEAGAGEILITEQVADAMGPEVPLDDRGLRPLKGLTQPRHLLSVRWSADPARGTAEH